MNTFGYTLQEMCLFSCEGVGQVLAYRYDQQAVELKDRRSDATAVCL